MAHPPHPVRLTDLLTRIDGHWSPKIAAEANGWHLKLVKVLGEFVWHAHDHVDEVFWILAGELTIHLDGRPDVHLHEGEVFVVPAGVRHLPYAEHECHLALLEPAGVPNTGDAGGTRTAADVWL